MKLAIVLSVALLVIGLAAGVGSADPYFGFVTVPGSFTHDDFGPDPRIMGETLRWSAATCVRADIDEAVKTPLLGRPGIGYAHTGMDASDIQLFNNHGYYYFIFENEPDGTAGTNPNWAQDYMTRLAAAYPIIKGVSSSNQVIGGNLYTFNYDLLYDYGLKANSEQIGFHCYSNDPATGIAIDNVKPVHDVMVSRGDGDKKIFLGEGWGPMRELPGLKRLFPDAAITPGEISMLRDFVVNGYWSIVTSKANYDPDWVWAVLFFTLNDNWGGRFWADRAVPNYDGQGNLIYYTVDGYNVGLDIFPHFYNGGLIDVDGNAKDNLMDLFPGKGLALGNSGFEYMDRGISEAVAADWSPRLSPAPASAYGIDASIRRGGQRSQRLTLGATSQEYIWQDSVKASATAGQLYSAIGWVKTHEVVKGSGRGAAIKLDFLDASWAVIGSGVWSTGLEGTNGWTKLTATAVAPANTSKVRVVCELSGTSGRAWFDDVCASQGSAASMFTGYVLNTQRNPVEGASVTTTTGGYSAITDEQGYFSIPNVEPGVYDLCASKAGYSSRTAKAQLALPGKTRPLGFSLPPSSSTVPAGVRVEDPAVGGLLKISWTNPTGPFDHVQVYRSTDPQQLGTLVFDEVSAPPVWDTTVVDGTKYRYTVRSVIGGVESTNNDYYYGISSGGLISSAYSEYPGAVWGHWAANFGQTFKATRTGSIGGASCTPGFGGGGGASLTFSIHEGGPTGPQIGPSAGKWAAGDQECTVTWNQGEVPVTQGQTYYLKVVGSAGFAAYRGGDVYPDGCFYINGAAQTTSDMWSTITVVEAKSVVITDVAASESPAGTVEITWKTSAPSTSQVEYGATEAYGNASEVDPTPVTEHSIVLTGLDHETAFHFRAKSTRPGLPEAASLDYIFVTAPDPDAPSTIAQAKTQPDGTWVQLTNKIVTAGNDLFSGQFYIEDLNRTSGMRVIVGSSGINVREGDLVDVSGMMSTTYGERQMISPTASIIERGAPVPDPLWMANRSVGGADLHPLAPGVFNGLGAHNVGLLIGAWGRVTHVDDAGSYFYLDDGTGLADGSGYPGLRVSCGGLASGNSISPPAPNSYVRVTGISSKLPISGEFVRVLRPRSQADVVTVE